ncbi:phosphonate C-P lyase system protein PhnH [Roseateles oligotrophus]|uniref:Phosphonate C-P lyase system protein PhnH n=1 Tax=Roseateles oligotrophus TaxID=1769250 RepID=A0ABT2YC20_9BURK|nr:phosphonate C-P lyase system protein PhnH [Roseateles oligotrophus]MCV2367592.1 phosphonate C-P lyase system protein PhnH [Roseateles oligotrophus]
MNLANHLDGNHDLAAMKRGFTEPVFGAQQVFRQLLDAMALPGRVHELAAVDSGVQLPTKAFGLAMTLSLLTLLDAESPLHLAAELGSKAAAAYFRFHCGAKLAEPGLAQFTAVQAADLATPNLGTPIWQALPLGSDEQPQLGGTLLLEVSGLDEKQALAGAALLTLRGPGIASEQTLAVQGLPPEFWRWRQALLPAFPRGIELMLCCGSRLAAIPRSTLITLES